MFLEVVTLIQFKLTEFNWHLHNLLLRVKKTGLRPSLASNVGRERFYFMWRGG